MRGLGHGRISLGKGLVKTYQQTFEINKMWMQDFRMLLNRKYEGGEKILRMDVSQLKNTLFSDAPHSYA